VAQRIQVLQKVSKENPMLKIDTDADPFASIVWPHLLSQLEYKKTESEEGDSIGSDGDS
jgi:hypothetical protein